MWQQKHIVKCHKVLVRSFDTTIKKSQIKHKKTKKGVKHQTHKKIT